MKGYEDKAYGRQMNRIDSRKLGNGKWIAS